jgi:hypothetical protein
LAENKVIVRQVNEREFWVEGSRLVLGEDNVMYLMVWKEIIENERTDRIAIFGLHPVARVIASFIMGVTKKKEMRFFKTKEEALRWLKEAHNG